MTFRLGLTGSIGTGKTTTAGFFAELGVPVWNADAAVHHLYEPGGQAVEALRMLCPDVITTDGGVSRTLLRARIAASPDLLDRVNGIVHPLVAQDRNGFLADHADKPVVVLDIPLLFENGLEEGCDGVVVVTAPPEIQKRRVLDRGEMTESEFEMIMARQMPDAEKRARATWVIETITFDAVRASVARVLKEIRARQTDA